MSFLVLSTRSVHVSAEVSRNVSAEVSSVHVSAEVSNTIIEMNNVVVSQYLIVSSFATLVDDTATSTSLLS